MPTDLQLTPIHRISPSIFYAFKKCALHGTLVTSKAPKMLPNSPNAYIGNIIHETIKIAKEEKISEKRDFESIWSELVDKKEKAMTKSWIEKHLVPIKEYSTDYEVKKLLCKKFVNNLSLEKQKSEQYSSISEKFIHQSRSEIWLQSTDGKVGGYADAIIPTENGDIIIDYKTGKYIEESSCGSCPKVKEEYEIQLKLYSSLYHSEYGKWPVSLKIAGIDGTSVEVDFTNAECEEMLREAIEILNYTNNIIINKNLTKPEKFKELSSPNPENCKFCQYRPGCNSYLEIMPRNIRSEEKWPIDVSGTIIDRKILGNGNLFIKLSLDTDPSKIISIRNLSIERHPALNNIGNEVVIFSLLADSGDKAYQEGLLTTSFQNN